ncbi:MAG: hypothetical protein Q8R39_00775 [bacterium]|nr:hypothetical protein [bacterium]
MQEVYWYDREWRVESGEWDEELYRLSRLDTPKHWLRAHALVRARDERAIFFSESSRRFTFQLLAWRFDTLRCRPFG